MHLKQNGKGMMDSIIITNTNALTPGGDNVHHSLLQSKPPLIQSLNLKR